MLIDSHCHLSFPELNNNLPLYLELMAGNSICYALCVATHPDNIEQVVNIAASHHNLFATVGIHPDEKLENFNLTKDYLLSYINHGKVVAIGETGLDYYWNKDQDMSWQHERFNIHIDVARTVNLPLVVHTRESAYDTWSMLKDGDISECRGVIHCFTESIDWARKFLDLGCYISLSGIVTFKNAKEIQDVAKFVPLDRLLIETDAPYLAPVPFRGKLNHPALVKHTAQFIADLRQTSLTEIAQATTDNFFALFTKAKMV